MEISIIVPVYNRAYCLKSCLDSIQKQTFTDWECVLVDDGSTDNTLAICNEYASADNRFRVYSQKNGGVSAARNTALDKAQGTYITFVDSDDYIAPSFLEKLYAKVEKNTLPVCCMELEESSLYAFYHPAVSITLDAANGERFLKLNQTGLLFGPVCKLYNRSIIEKEKMRFTLGISFGEDVIFNYTYLLYIDKINVVPERLYHIVKSGDSLSCFPEKQSFEEHLARWKAINRFHNEKNLVKHKGELLNSEYYGIIWTSVYAVLYKHNQLSLWKRYAFVRQTLAHRSGLPYKDESKVFPAWKCFFIEHPFLYWIMSEVKYLKEKKR